MSKADLYFLSPRASKFGEGDREQTPSKQIGYFPTTQRTRSNHEIRGCRVVGRQRWVGGVNRGEQGQALFSRLRKSEGSGPEAGNRKVVQSEWLKPS